MKAQEIWKPVVGYEDFYEVSNFGRVKSIPRKGTKGGIMKPSPDDDGYLRVTLCKNGEKEYCQVHQLIMLAFVGKCPDGCEVDHIDGNPSNNCLENLRYVTHKENIHNPITKKRQKEASKKRSQNQEWQKNHAEALRRLSQDPEWQKNHTEAMQKLAQDPEWQKNVREGAKKRAADPEYLKKTAEANRKRCCKPVNQYTIDGEFVKTWSSTTEAARELGFQQTNISHCLHGNQHTAGGYIWKFA